MASTAIAICSNALQELGDDPINSFALAEGKRARTAGNLWPQVRNALMRAHPWTCLRRMAVLAPTNETPDMDWGYKFRLPSDWLRPLQIGERSSPIDHEIIGSHIYANTNVLPVKYIARIEDPASWDDLLVDLATAFMAWRLAYPITQSTTLSQEKRDTYSAMLRQAKSTNGQDNPADDWGDSPFTDIRY